MDYIHAFYQQTHQFKLCVEKRPLNVHDTHGAGKTDEAKADPERKFSVKHSTVPSGLEDNRWYICRRRWHFGANFIPQKRANNLWHISMGLYLASTETMIKRVLELDQPATPDTSITIADSSREATITALGDHRLAL